jgi:hypothetical protein
MQHPFLKRKFFPKYFILKISKKFTNYFKIYIASIIITIDYNFEDTFENVSSE